MIAASKNFFAFEFAIRQHIGEPQSAAPTAIAVERNATRRLSHNGNQSIGMESTIIAMSYLAKSARIRFASVSLIQRSFSMRSMDALTFCT